MRNAYEHDRGDELVATLRGEELVRAPDELVAQVMTCVRAGPVARPARAHSGLARAARSVRLLVSGGGRP